MRELLRRLGARPWMTTEVVVASLFINALAVVSPLIVIQILNRYVSYGFDGTLITLTVGMVLATTLSLVFTRLRGRLAGGLMDGHDRAMERAMVDALGTARLSELQGLTRGAAQKAFGSLWMVRSAMSSELVTTVVDGLFVPLYLLVIFLLSPPLALLTLVFVVVSVALGSLWLSAIRKRSDAAREVQSHQRGLAAGAVDGAETVRAFGGAGYLLRQWSGLAGKAEVFEQAASNARDKSRIATQGSSEFLRILLYALGAKVVAGGALSVGALIGVSILAARTHGLCAGLVRSTTALVEADRAMQDVARFLRLPRETRPDEVQSTLTRFSGRLSLSDVTFGYRGASGPLFESLSAEFKPGTLTVISGPNGAGKTSLARLLMGLVRPVRGQVLADGVELRQLPLDTYRNCVAYMPQDVFLLPGTVLDNLRYTAEGVQPLSPRAAAEVVRRAGLAQWLDQSPAGLTTQVTDGGASLSAGIRKRIALARALSCGCASGTVSGTVSGTKSGTKSGTGSGAESETESGTGAAPLWRVPRIAILDEPTESMDADGAAAVYAVLDELVRAGATVIVVTADPIIVRAARTVVDLGVKPVPRVLSVSPQQSAEGGTGVRRIRQ